MKRVTIGLFFTLSVIKLQAQAISTKELLSITEKKSNEITADSTKIWTSRGNISFIFNQSTFNNWLAGGENSISGNVGINYDLNYRKGEWSWDNKLIASYGMIKTSMSEYTKKTDDRLEFNSIIGKEATRLWFYSGFVNFRSQFAKGYLYSPDKNGVETRAEYTNFMSPAYLAFGPGLMWKKTNNFKFNLSPLTSRFVIVDRKFTLPNNAYFGVTEGKGVLYEFGFNIFAYYRFDLIKNVNIENIIALYSNYLEKPQNVDLDYQLNIMLKINNYLTTNIAFQTIYDNNAFRGFQIRKLFGLGINYAFSN